jgi:hypothetical protein
LRPGKHSNRIDTGGNGPKLPNISADVAAKLAVPPRVSKFTILNLWEQSLAGGEPQQFTKFSSGRIFDFDWSSDGKQLLLMRGDKISDVVLLSLLC